MDNEKAEMIRESQYRPSEDQLQDDLQRIVRIKEAFIYEMGRVYDTVPNQKQARVDLIAAEQSFDDALWSELKRIREYPEMVDAVIPKSKMYQAWLDESVPRVNAKE